MPPVFGDPELERWCLEHLGAPPVAVLFQARHLSSVLGLRLEDGREVVVKVRPAHTRLHACFEVQQHLHKAGFPCPAPLVPPSPLGVWAASAESLLTGGAVFPPSGRKPEPFARALAWLLRAAPRPGDVSSLGPSPPWSAWNHEEPGLWPRPDDLNLIGGPRWLDRAGAAARKRLGAGSGPTVIGHGDWYTANLRWRSASLHAVHDWDSAISDRETVVAGLASAIYCATDPGTEASVDESEAFLAAFADARGRPLTAGEAEECWAAGLWVRCFDSKKQVATAGDPLSLNEVEAQERLRRAGA